MRILMAGFGDQHRFTGIKGLEFAPLSQADEPTEYDFVFLRPSLLGGIFAPQEVTVLLDPTGTTVWQHRWQEARAMHVRLGYIGERLVVLGQMRGLVVVPCETEMIRYYEPRMVNPTVAQLNQSFGRSIDNFIEHRVFNFDVLEYWKLIAPAARGSSGVVTMPGHPLARYVEEAKFRWEAAFDIAYSDAAQMRTIAMDRSGSYRIALELSVAGSYLYGIPEPAGRQDLDIAIECLSEARTWQAGRADIRSQQERSIEGRIRRGQEGLGQMALDLGELEGELREARSQREAVIASRSELAEALADYTAGREQHSLALFHRAYERLKKYYREHHSGEESAFLDWLGVSDGKRRKFGRITNLGERHAPDGGSAPQPEVSDEEFEEARSFVQEILERYLANVQSGK